MPPEGDLERCTLSDYALHNDVSVTLSYLPRVDGAIRYHRRTEFS